jgi:hypothetical protein
MIRTCLYEVDCVVGSTALASCFMLMIDHWFLFARIGRDTKMSRYPCLAWKRRNRLFFFFETAFLSCAQSNVALFENKTLHGHDRCRAPMSRTGVQQNKPDEMSASRVMIAPPKRLGNDVQRSYLKQKLHSSSIARWFDRVTFRARCHETRFAFPCLLPTIAVPRADMPGI